jgi:hypothetical protein
MSQHGRHSKLFDLSGKWIDTDGRHYIVIPFDNGCFKCFNYINKEYTIVRIGNILFWGVDKKYSMTIADDDNVSWISKTGLKPFVWRRRQSDVSPLNTPTNSPSDRYINYIKLTEHNTLPNLQSSQPNAPPKVQPNSQTNRQVNYIPLAPSKAPPNAPHNTLPNLQSSQPNAPPKVQPNSQTNRQGNYIPLAPSKAPPKAPPDLQSVPLNVQPKTQSAQYKMQIETKAPPSCKTIFSITPPPGLDLTDVIKQKLAFIKFIKRNKFAMIRAQLQMRNQVPSESPADIEQYP